MSRQASVRTRAIAGIAAGAVAAVLGPMLGAVANHTANASGNEVVRADAARGTERSGSATWVHERVRFRFEVVERSRAGVRVDGAASQDAGRTTGGTVRAWLELCDERGRSCVRGQSWEGRLGSPLTEGGAFSIAPDRSTASFRGWLTDVDAGSGCLFEVNWDLDPTIAPVVEAGGETADGRSDAAASIAERRAAVATVVAACWRADGEGVFAGGLGEVAERDDVGVTAIDDTSSVHVDRRR